MNKMRRDEIKNSLQIDLRFLCAVGNPTTNLLLGDRRSNQKETYRAESKPKGTLLAK